MILKKIHPRSYISLLLIFLFYLTSCSVIPKAYKPGASYLNETGYVEYLPGTLPLVISVPHGGYLTPENIPDRKCEGCVYDGDSYTQELARSIRDHFFKQTGYYPHIVINLLSRKKFDANRNKTDAADGNQIVEKAWFEYHDFLEKAKTQITKDHKRGLFLDLHGHGHKIQRIELGYLLNKDELQLPDSDLNTDAYIDKSSIKKLIGNDLQHLSFPELLRGNSSLGTIFNNNEVPAVPSTLIPHALNNERYFDGGYNTERHGSLNGGNIDGIQVECHQGIRFNTAKREQFANIFVTSVREFMLLNYNN